MDHAPFLALIASLSACLIFVVKVLTKRIDTQVTETLQVIRQSQRLIRADQEVSQAWRQDFVAWAKTRDTFLEGAVARGVREASGSWQADQLLQAILDSAALLAVNLDDGTIRWTSPRLDAIFGYLPGELIGQPVEVLVPESVKATHLHYRETYRQNPMSRPIGMGKALLGRRKDGREFPADISLAPRMVAGQIVVVATVHDLSEALRFLPHGQHATHA